MSNTITPSKFVRKPMFVDAVQITEENFAAIAEWCQGTITRNDGVPVTWTEAEIDPSSMYIHVRVHKPLNPKQTQAHVGDWLLYSDRGYKVYTDKAFRANFDDAMAKPEDPQMNMYEVDVTITPSEDQTPEAPEVPSEPTVEEQTEAQFPEGTDVGSVEEQPVEATE